jgi:hypothetical protein
MIQKIKCFLQKKRLVFQFCAGLLRIAAFKEKKIFSSVHFAQIEKANPDPARQSREIHIVLL